MIASNSASATVFLYLPSPPSQSNTAREFLSQSRGIQISTDTTDLEKRRFFLRPPQAEYDGRARRDSGDFAGGHFWKLTRAERVRLHAGEEGNLRLPRPNSKGEPLLDDTTIIPLDFG